MEKLRDDLYKSIENLGPLHPATIVLSQKLDLLIVKEMKGNT